MKRPALCDRRPVVEGLPPSRLARFVAIVLAVSAAAPMTGWSQDGGSRQPRDLGRVRDPELDEVSGLAAGRLNVGVLWAHNDSGDSARLFAVDLDGRTVAVVTLEGARARDWEDIAIATVSGRSMLYIGDIGDNAAKRKDITVYRFPEPALPGGSGPLSVTVFDTITLIYPDGPRNAETLLVDPTTGDLVIVTKGSATPEVYRAAIGSTIDEPIVLRRVGTLELDTIPFGNDEREGSVGGDVSADGRFALVKSYLRMYRYEWDGMCDMPFVGDPRSLPYVPEPQGESVALSVDRRTYYTLSEKIGDRIPRLYAYGLQ